MSDTSQLAIIIVNYKMDDLTISFVRDELARLTVPHKTVIVNNAATDQSNAALCQNLGAQLVADGQGRADVEGDIFVLPAEENLGFARGNNLGAEFCREAFSPQFIIFSNNDIQIPDPQVASVLIGAMQAHPEAGVAGPEVVGLDGRRQSPFPYQSCWDREVWLHWATFLYSKEQHARRFRLNYAQEAAEGLHHHVLGCFFMVRAQDYYDCGMMDPHTFLYAEEKILAERMKAIGRGVYYCPQSRVVHAHGATTNRHSEGRSYRWQVESNLYYYRTYRHTPLPVIWLARLTHRLVRLRH